MHADTEQQETQKEIRNVLGVIALVTVAVLLTALVFFIFSPVWTLVAGTTKGVWPPLRETLHALLVTGTFIASSWYAYKSGRVLLGYEKPGEKTIGGGHAFTAKATRAEHGRSGTGRMVVYGLLLLIVVDLAFWGIRWLNNKVIPQPPPAPQAAARAPMAPPQPEFIATNKFGLSLVKTVEEITVRAGERSQSVRVSPPAETASWGTWEPNNLLVFLNGEPIPVNQSTTNRIVFNQEYSFSAKSNTVGLWVATGIKKPNRSGH